MHRGEVVADGRTAHHTPSGAQVERPLVQTWDRDPVKEAPAGEGQPAPGYMSVLTGLCCMLMATLANLGNLAIAQSPEPGYWVCGAGSTMADGRYRFCTETMYALNGTCESLKPKQILQ